jgi:hypothetical protein
MTAAQYRTPKNEKELQAQIVKTAKQFGWRVSHYPYALGADPGYPDLTCFHPEYDKLWIECKGPKAPIRPAQVECLAAINAGPTGLGIMAFPDDLDAVCRLLAGQPVEIYEDTRIGVLRVRLIERQ